MSKTKAVFDAGKFTVRLVNLGTLDTTASPSTTPLNLPPPKPLLVATPCEEGEYPVLVFFHGYLLYNSFYSLLFHHVASHGFIVVAPQLHLVAGPDCEDEINCAAGIVDWLLVGLCNVLPSHVRPSPTKIGVAGHSRGGKVAFALALRHAKTTLKISAVIGVDPVDGMDKGKQTNPPILTYVPRSFDLKMPALVIGSGLGELRKNPFFPPCAPKGVSHQNFFEECCAPAYHFVAKDYGHLDMLDDETKGIRGKATYCLCKNGGSRRAMREFVGGAITAFMKAHLEGDPQFMLALVNFPEISPVELTTSALLESEFKAVS